MSDEGEQSFAALVEAAPVGPEGQRALVALLAEGSPHYAGKGRAAIVRMRGFALAAFERVGLPDEAIPFVIEELESGIDPYLVAAAARAVRGRSPLEPAFARPLVKAVRNMRGGDDLLSFAGYSVYATSANGATSIREIAATLAQMGPAAAPAKGDLAEVLAEGGLPRKDKAALEACLKALDDSSVHVDDCCKIPLFSEVGGPRDQAPDASMRELVLEDQDGARVRFEDALMGRPTIVVFFYTRCDNPRKCSLTVSKLGGVQAMLAEEGLLDAIGTAAITYDPAYDLPARLLPYGRARRMIEHPRHKLLRSVADHERLRGYFQTGVSFLSSIVSRHRIECFLLDAEGRVRASFTRTQWDEAEVVRAAKALLEAPAPSNEDKESLKAPSQAPSPPRPNAAPQAAASVVLSVLAALFPKCPVCWAAYLSVLGVAGVERLPHAPWLIAVFAALMVVNLGSLWIRTRGQQSRLGLYLSTAGALVILLGSVWLSLPYASFVGIALTVAGSLAGVARAGASWLRSGDSSPRDGLRVLGERV